MKIKDILAKKDFIFSMEIFPPKPDSDISVIYDTLNGLKDLKPDYISVTYGAGGTSRDRTVQIADKINNTYGITALAHLTCVGATKEYMTDILNQLKEKGIENVLAMRGDIPEGEENPLKDFKYAVDLVKFIKSNPKWDFCIGVAGYPEKHVEAPSMEEDIKHLKEKVDAGADFIVTQLFMDNDYFFEYKKLIKAAGVDVPVLPGVMTATLPKQIERMVELSGCNIPDRFKNVLKQCDPHAKVCEPTVDYTVGQIDHLIKHGVKGIHLYTMNKVAQNKRIYEKSKLTEREL